MITVFGLWHLGCVTAACCAEHFPTFGLDFDNDRIDNLKKGKAPLFEPGLDELIQQGMSSNQLQFSTDAKEALAETQILWVTYDTPVDQDDNADVDFVLDQVRQVLPHLKPGAVILVSSQLPVGSIRKLEAEFKDQQLHFASSPENLRLGKALDIFRNPDRIIVGIRGNEAQEKLKPVLKKFSESIIWMSVESAEMTKHAINSFLAMSVTFANELARLCESMGANAQEVAQGLKSESRIGPKAYVAPGGAFAGGTLARDIQFLTQLGEQLDQRLSLIPSVKISNDYHKQWPILRLQQHFPELSGKTIAVLGLTYKPGTNTLRRSSSVELCQKLLAQGARVSAFDPAITTHEPEIEGIDLQDSVTSAVEQANAVVIMTEWPEFRELDWEQLIGLLKNKIIIDPNRFCSKQVKSYSSSQLTYLSVGVA